MVSKDEFRNYVKTIAENNKTDINNDFKKGKKTGSFISIIFFLVVIVEMFAILSGQMYAGIIIFIVAFVLIFISILARLVSPQRNSNPYKSSEYKNDVIQYLLKDYDYSYDKDGGIDVSEYKKSPMYTQFTKYETEDYLKINISKDSTHKSDCWFNICDLHTYNEVREEVRNSHRGHNHNYGGGVRINVNLNLGRNFNDGGLFNNDPFDNDSSDSLFDDDFNRYETRIVDVFNGSFGYIQFNESFKSNLYINCSSDSFEGKAEHVKLENINFNKKFWVYSTDQVEARYILTPRMMELVDELNDKVNGGATKIRRVISIALVGNRMYFTFSGGFKLFELNRHYRNTSEIFDDFYDDMEIILNLVKEIQNNNKIFKI